MHGKVDTSPILTLSLFHLVHRAGRCHAAQTIARVWHKYQLTMCAAPFFAQLKKLRNLFLSKLKLFRRSNRFHWVVASSWATAAWNHWPLEKLHPAHAKAAGHLGIDLSGEYYNSRPQRGGRTAIVMAKAGHHAMPLIECVVRDMFLLSQALLTHQTGDQVRSAPNEPIPGRRWVRAQLRLSPWSLNSNQGRWPRRAS